MNIKSQLYKIIKENKTVIFGSDQCLYCQKAKKLLKKAKYVDILEYANRYDKSPSEIISKLSNKTNNYQYIPIIFHNQKFIGGYEEARTLFSSKK